ncbi:hypothetical protein EV174_000284 [Coemansia sp. RSA 2320]|nr:hypothetical protein EV174_000284 [Coemansia sp. RSA 2320]
MADTLSVFCGYSDDKKTDFYVKIDDDLIMSPSELDDIIRHMAATPCQYAGGMYTRDGFYWATGQIYIFTRAVFDELSEV